MSRVRSGARSRGVATSLVGLASPFLVKHLIDDAIPHQNVGLLLALVGAMLAINVVSQLLGVLQTWMSPQVGQQVMHDLRTRLFGHLQRMPVGFFTRTRSGEVQSRATNDINAMQSVVTDSATSIASDVTTAVGTAIAMGLLSWRLSLLSLVVLPPAIWLTRRVAHQRRAIQSKAQRTLADMQTQIEESLSINGVILAKTLGSGPTLSSRVADNLRYARPDATDEEIVAAARAAQVHDLISALPDGYDTLVGSRGYRFSGGEKQRIALARTILRDPRILVLDEATSALDNATERAVQRAIDNASDGRTTITIAHRLSTVRGADLIVVLEHGRIVERGSHEQLLLRGGRYAQLWESQLAAPAA